jgi:hypothetical protein
MIIETLCLRLLEIGKTEIFKAVFELPGAESHHEVLRIAGKDRGYLLAFFRELDPEDRRRFFKAIAAYEDSVGGLGSVTVLQQLLPDLPDEDHSTFDWVLTNTKAYWYYAHGARSYAEIQEWKHTQSIRKEASSMRERQREIEAKRRKAVVATTNLYNAVRRGDKKAVIGLLSQGAGPASKTPDGLPLVQYALTHGHDEIAALLSSARSR